MGFLLYLKASLTDLGNFWHTISSHSWLLHACILSHLSLFVLLHYLRKQQPSRHTVFPLGGLVAVNRSRMFIDQLMTDELQYSFKLQLLTVVQPPD